MLVTVRRHLRWAAPVAVLVVAALLRLWNLAHPDQLVFDELYYVRDAVSQLAHGYSTVWPDDDPAFGGERARAFGDAPNGISHPPLGKWLIGLGILALGADDGWGWRIAVALSGVAAVGITMRLGFLMTRSMLVACLAGLLLALDGVHVVLARVSLLDGFLATLILLGTLFVWRDQAAVSAETRAPRLGIIWRRPWLLAAGLTFGAAAAVKWSGLYPLAAFLILITVRDYIQRRRIAPRGAGFGRQSLVTAAIALPAAFVAYLASWIGWMLHPGAQGRSPGEPWWESLWNWHTGLLAWHSTLTAEHPSQASPLTWPLGLRPTSMYRVTTPQGADCDWAGGCTSIVSTLPNPAVTWGGAAALILLLWIAARALWRASRFRSLAPLGRPGQWAVAVILTGYLSGILPWLFTARTAVFHFYAVVLTPFSALALALVLAALCRPDGGEVMRLAGVRLDGAPASVFGRRIAVLIFLTFAAVLAVLFFPLWSGISVADWFSRAHMWLPGWH